MTNPTFDIVKDLLEENDGDPTELLRQYPYFRPDENTLIGTYPIPYLHRACSLDSLPLVKGLLAAGANPKSKDGLGYPPVFYAASRLPGASPHIVLWLLTNCVEARSTVAWTTESGWGPLYITARSGNAAIARILLKYDAKPLAHRFESLLPSQLAQRSGNHIVAKIFKRAEDIIELSEWRPWKHSNYTRPYRLAMKTLVVLAKVIKFN